MLPIQEVEITTKNGCRFFVHLEKWRDNRFECKLASIKLGGTLGNAEFGPFAGGSTAVDAFADLVSKLRASLARADSTDAIEAVSNPCNTEFLEAKDQKETLGSSVAVSVNGHAA